MSNLRSRHEQRFLLAMALALSSMTTASGELPPELQAEVSAQILEGLEFIRAQKMQPDALVKLDPGLRHAVQTKSTGKVRVLIKPDEVKSLPVTFKQAFAKREDRLQAAYATLAETSVNSQRSIRSWLDKNKISSRAFSVVNAIAAEVSVAQLLQLAALEEVKYLADDPVVQHSLPSPALAKDACSGAAGLPWGVTRVNADDVWALGFRGQGVVVAGQDTGYDWDHPALIAQYRGSDGVVDHNYNWHDSIHALIGGANSCGLNLVAPCDDNGHGTHTMGTMAGEDDVGAFTIGVAPDAQWIGCRNMEEGAGMPSTYLECFDWFLAPTDLAGFNPDPAQAPHVINNSWTCPASEGCTPANWGLIDTAINNLTAAGILVVASAGNSGPSCSTVQDPPAIFANALSVGATNGTPDNSLASFSSRGPVTIDGSNRLKPDIVAPGVSICSSLPGTGYGLRNGTSMAGPHVAGVAALLMSAFPVLKNDPPAIRNILEQAALPIVQGESCGVPVGDRPNPDTGWGLVDALAAYQNAYALYIVFADGFE